MGWIYSIDHLLKTKTPLGALSHLNSTKQTFKKLQNLSLNTILMICK
jgi:hypothetical protein